MPGKSHETRINEYLCLRNQLLEMLFKRDKSIFLLTSLILIFCFLQALGIHGHGDGDHADHDHGVTIEPYVVYSLVVCGGKTAFSKDGVFTP